MQPFTKSIKALDANRIRFILEIEVTTRNWYFEFSLCWEWWGSSGQNLDRLSPRTEGQEKIIAFWKKHHIKEITEKDYKKLNKIISLLEADRFDDPIWEDDYDGLTWLYSDREIAVAIMLWLSENEMSLDVVDRCDETEIEIQGTEYYFGDDEEMDREYKESIERLVDEVIMHEIEKTWFSNYITIDIDAMMADNSRGNELNRYDGWELSCKVNWTYYYMYQK